MSRVVVVVVVIVVWCTVRGDWRIGLEIRARLKRSAGRRALCVCGELLREGKGRARLAAAEEANGMNKGQ